ADRLLQLRAAARLHDGDPTLWPGDETDRQTISQSLGWLDEPHRQRGGVAALHRHATWVRDRGFRHAVLVAAGGASVAATVFQRTFGKRPGFPELMVVDSTDPDQVAAVMAQIDPARSLLLLASQGGARVEDSALWDIFLKRWRDALGEAAGEHCLAITAPGSPLEELAHELRFHRVWPVSPGARGPYGALSDYGLVPATTVGVDIDQLLAGAVSMADACFSEASTRGVSGPGLELAAVLAGCATAGRDKATVLTHAALGAVPLWLAPLLAQSTAKSGPGLVPVIGEPRAEPRDYGDDRLFIYLELEGAGADPDTEDWLAEVAAAGHPVVRVPTAHPLDLGAEFYRWEVATALAAALLGVDPFGLPEVAERAKRISDLLTTWEKDRRVPEPGVDLIDGCIRVAGAPGADSLAQALRHWLRGMEPPAHLGVVAYLPERPDHPEDQALVRRLREGLLRASGCATTFGYGSSGVEFNGQLRQGGRQDGASLQITGAHRGDLAIPGRPYPLGILQQAEAVADYRALAGSARRVLRVHCDEVGRGLGQLARAVEDLLLPVGN
ncbi:MAG: hypothetical protein ACREN1_00560, partial [Candidatus Dormibacteria bacterium]